MKLSIITLRVWSSRWRRLEATGGRSKGLHYSTWRRLSPDRRYNNKNNPSCRRRPSGSRIYKLRVLPSCKRLIGLCAEVSDNSFELLLRIGWNIVYNSKSYFICAPSELEYRFVYMKNTYDVCSSNNCLLQNIRRISRTKADSNQDSTQYVPIRNHISMPLQN